MTKAPHGFTECMNTQMQLTSKYNTRRLKGSENTYLTCIRIRCRGSTRETNITVDCVVGFSWNPTPQPPSTPEALFLHKLALPRPVPRTNESQDHLASTSSGLRGTCHQKNSETYSALQQILTESRSGADSASALSGFRRRRPMARMRLIVFDQLGMWKAHVAVGDRSDVLV